MASMIGELTSYSLDINKKYEEIANFIKQKLGKSATKIIPNGLLKVGVFLNAILGWLISPLKMANKVNVQSVTEFNKISNKKINWNNLSINKNHLTEISTAHKHCSSSKTHTP